MGCSHPKVEGGHCSVCGEAVTGLPLDFAWSLPDDLWALPEAERSRRGKWSPDFATLDERRFVRSLVGVPIDDGEEFRFGVWIEVDPPVFDAVVRAWNDPVAYAALAFSGRLANELPVADGATRAVVRLGTRDPSSRPFAVASEDPALQAMIAHGWTFAEYEAVARSLGAA